MPSSAVSILVALVGDADAALVEEGAAALAGVNISLRTVS